MIYDFLGVLCWFTDFLHCFWVVYIVFLMFCGCLLNFPDCFCDFGLSLQVQKLKNWWIEARPLEFSCAELKFFLRKNDTTIFIPSGAKVPNLRQMAHQQMLASKSLSTSSSYHFCCQLSFAKAKKWLTSFDLHLLRASPPRTLNWVPFLRLQTWVKNCGPTAGPIWVPSLQPTSNFMVVSPHLGTAKSP
jgi:hypothetical protein